MILVIVLVRSGNYGRGGDRDASKKKYLVGIVCLRQKH